MLPQLALNSLYQMILGPSASRVPGAEVYASTPGFYDISSCPSRACSQLPHSPRKSVIFLSGFSVLYMAHEWDFYTHLHAHVHLSQKCALKLLASVRTFFLWWSVNFPVCCVLPIIHPSLLIGVISALGFYGE